MCIQDDELLARLDGELAPAEATAVDAHLAECARCRERSQTIAARSAEVTALLSELGPAEAATDPGFVLARLRARALDIREEQDAGGRRWFGRRWAPVWGLAAALITAVCFYSGPTAAMAQKFLGLFRVKTVVAVPVDFRFANDGDGKVLSQMLSQSVTVTKNEQPQPAATRADAARLAGFAVRLPAMRQDAPRLTVTGEQASHFTVDMKRLRTMMDLVNRPDLELPAGLEGARIAVDIPRGVRAAYGDCEKRDAAQGCLLVIQTPVPTVATLPEINLREVAELGLQVAGMTREEAARFSHTVDWTSALAIPIPVDAAGYENVEVDGVKGVLVTTRARGEHPAWYVLVWIKDGIVYTLGSANNPSLAVPLANSLG